jgi:hypothetical protein
MDLTTVGKWLLVIGLGLAGLGLAVWLAGKAGLPIGRLPGDLHVRGEKGSFYFPIVTCIVVSLVLTLVINLVFRLFR